MMRSSTYRGGLRRLAALPLGALLALSVTILPGCGDDPVSAIYEGKGVALQGSAGTDIAVDSAGTVTGGIVVDEGKQIGPIDVFFIAKGDGKRGEPSDVSYTLEWTFADGTLATIVPLDRYKIKITGLKAGTTTVKFTLRAGAGTAFTSNAIPVTVNPGVRGLAMGDTATFNYYDRDSVNQRVTASQMTRTWTPLAVGMNVFGKTNVTLIKQETRTLAGSVVAVDSVYMLFDADGSVYQYDLLRMLLSRTSSGTSFSDKLEPLWVKISNVNKTGNDTWKSFGSDSQEVKNLTVDGIPLAVDLTFRMNAAHRGTHALTVPAGNYADAVHTDHTVGLMVKPSSLPVTALNDSLMVRMDLSPRDGVIREVFESKTLVAKVLTATQELPVTGFEMELTAIKRKP